MNLLLSPIAAPFKAPLQDQSCWAKKPDHFVLLYSTGSGCILSIHHHYQKWHTVCSCSCSFRCESTFSILTVPVMGWEIHFINWQTQD